MTRLSLITFAFLFLLSSCDKDTMTDPDVVDPSDYNPMAVGNYWIYQTLKENAEGILEIESSPDSITIVGIETINEKDYFRFESTFENKTYLRRDSAGYILDEEGEIIFSPKDDVEIISTDEVKNGDQLLLKIDYSMNLGTSEISVPAGVFNTRSKIANITPGPTFEYNCTNKQQYFYAPKIGLVRQDLHYVGDCKSLNMELIDYNVN